MKSKLEDTNDTLDSFYQLLLYYC